MLLHWFVLGVIYSLAFSSALPYELIEEGREAKKTCTLPLPTTKSRTHPGHPSGSLILDQDFVVTLMILESKRE